MGRDDQRVRRIKQYVLARLRDELGSAPRGAQAKLARRLGVSGAHLSNMVSATPTRQPGEDFRRKVASHWGVTYAALEALALGEDRPRAMGTTDDEAGDPTPANLELAASEYAWTHELPHELRVVVREQARQYYVYSRTDLSPDDWHRILTGLERAALAVAAYQVRTVASEPAAAPARKRRSRR